ncbi:MAG: cytochrome c oxidase subunit II [Geminicoccaceae bacterium]
MPLLILTISMVLFGAGDVLAQGVAEPWQLGFQEAASPIMERITSFHNLLLWIITIITIFVLGLMAYVCVRFKASNNPVPSKRTHHAMLEVAWTAIPVLILVVIAIPSFKLLYYQDVVEDAEMTLKAIGRQWYWSYEYPDHGNFTFDAFMIADEDIDAAAGQKRLLETDNRVVVPVETNIRLLTTASDVIHAWAIPAFGIKIDAVPGHMNEMWFRVDKPGTYYGQCSELCGAYHGFMPIAVEAVSKDEFEAWVKRAEEEFAKAPSIDVATR